MMTSPKQELLPPVSKGPTGLSGWLHWLTDPLPRRWMLPATGLLIMALDWLFFSQEAASLGIAIPLASLVGFLAGGLGTFFLQRHYGRDSRLAAGLKSLLAGILVGIPFPLAGTLVGVWILTTSGLIGLKDRLRK